MSEPEAPGDVVAFLNARLDDREAAAEAVAPLGHVTDMGSQRLDDQFSHARRRFASEDGRSRLESDAAAERHFALYGPDWALREVCVMRRVVRELEILSTMTLGAGPEMARLLLRNLAEIDEGHPDYRRWLPVAVPELPLSRTGAEDEATARGFAQEAQAGLQYVMLPQVWGQRFSGDERAAAEGVRAALLRELDATGPADL